MKKIDTTHEKAREFLEDYLKKKGREILTLNFIPYPDEFVKKHRLGNRFKGHSFDIWTDEEIIEITDYNKHSKKNQKINDGIVADAVKTHLPRWKFYTIQKEEIVNEKGVMQPDAYTYLKEHLF